MSMVSLVPIGAIGGGGSSGPVDITDVNGVTSTGLASATAVDKPAGRTAIGAADDTAVLHKTGNESKDGVLTLTSIPVLPASDPTTANQAARKSYVDSAASSAAATAVGGVTASGIGAVPTARQVAGTALTADIPPAALANSLGIASTTQKGTVEIATTTEAKAGTAGLVIDGAGLAAAQASRYILCTWDTGTSTYKTVAGDAVPTAATPPRLYNTVPYDTASVSVPTAYGPYDQWLQKPSS
jgi:hypothetical protein